VFHDVAYIIKGIFIFDDTWVRVATKNVALGVKLVLYEAGL
jgi:hypothetical protein